MSDVAPQARSLPVDGRMEMKPGSRGTHGDNGDVGHTEATSARKSEKCFEIQERPFLWRSLVPTRFLLPALDAVMRAMEGACAAYCRRFEFSLQTLQPGMEPCSTGRQLPRRWYDVRLHQS